MTHTLVLNADMSPLSFLPLSTLSWQDSVRALYLGTVQTIHEYENWSIHSPSLSLTVPAIVMTKRYIKVKRNVSFTDNMVFLRDSYQCHYCKEIFPESKLTVDHVVPKSHGGGKNWLNLVSACAPCNSKRGNNVRIQPFKKPHKPTYWDMVRIKKQQKLSIPHISWKDFLNWDDDNLIEINPPHGMPGYKRVSHKFLRELIEEK